MAIINFFVGTFIPPDDEKKWMGVVGYNGTVKPVYIELRYNEFSVIVNILSPSYSIDRSRSKGEKGLSVYMQRST